MQKKLSDMTLEELWQLFPIILTAPDSRWPAWYAEEENLLRGVLPPEFKVGIHHIGSTAIPEIWAKPIVDILVEAAPGADLSLADEALARAGYRCMSRAAARRSYNKGYTEAGFAEKVFHLHLVHAGEQKEVLYRDYLRAHPDDAKQYEALKLSLWKPYEHDRDGYTEAKTGLVEEILRREKEENAALDR